LLFRFAEFHLDRIRSNGPYEGMDDQQRKNEKILHIDAEIK